MTPEELAAKKQEIADARKAQVAAVVKRDKAAFSAALQGERAALAALKFKKN